MKTQRGFADYLQYLHKVRPNIIKLKNGAFMGGYLYRGPDKESASKENIESIVAHFNNAIKTLDEGWMIQQIVIRVPSRDYPNGHFDELTNYLIDVERGVRFIDEGVHFETFHFLFLTYLPPMLHQSKNVKRIADWLMGKSLEKGKDYENRDIKYFEETLERFETIFSQEIFIRRLSYTDNNDELVHAVNLLLNRRNHRFMHPILHDIDCVLAHDIENGDFLVYGDQLVAILTLDGFPAYSRPAILSGLDSMPMEMMWSNRFIMMDQNSARNIINDRRKKWTQKERSMIAKVFNTGGGTVDQDAVAMAQETEMLTSYIENNTVALGHYTSTVVVYADDEDMLRRKIKEVVKVCETVGFNVRVEKTNALEAFIGSLPGHGRENVRKPILHSLCYGDLAPLHAIWSGSEHCPCPEPNYPAQSPPLIQAASIGTSPFRLNLHIDDVGHTLIVGPTGSGKSTLLALIASQFDRYQRARIFIFDKGYSIYPLTRACFDAAHYDLGHFQIGGGLGGLCPLANLDTEEDRAWALEYILTLIDLQMKKVVDKISAKDKSLIQEALKTMADATENANERTITHFIMTVQSEIVKELLKAYQVGSTAGNFVDGTQDNIRYQSMTCFEMDELMQYGQHVVAAVLLYLFRQIEKRLDGSPTLLIIDEAWAALDIPSFEEKIREWLKVLRKKNCAVILATQNVSDIAKSSICSALVESCPTKIYLANPEANNEFSRKIYADVMGLNHTQILLIAGMVRKRQYYITNALGRRVFELGLGPIALSFLGAANKEDLKQINDLIDRYGDEWPAEWLNARGLKDAGEAWKNGYTELFTLSGR